MKNFDTTKRIAVIGDVMVDEYYMGIITRQSPEAPVPVVTLNKHYSTLGGAANVANNLKALGYEPYLIGAVGRRDCGQFLSLLEEKGISNDGILLVDGYVTTTKTRVMGNGEHVCRVDREEMLKLTPQQVASIVIPEDIDVVVFSDYAKGMCSRELVRRVIDTFSGLIIVDPKDDFDKYLGVGIIKPNLLEATRYAKTDNIDDACRYIYEHVKPTRGVVVTLGANGALMYNGSYGYKQAYRTTLVDITGAGDTVTSVLAAGLISGYTLEESVDLANKAASIKIQQLGVGTVSPKELFSGIE